MKLDWKTIQAAIMQLVEDYKFNPMQIAEIVNLWLKSAFKKDNPEYKKCNIQVQIDEQWEIHIYQIFDVVEEVTDPNTEISLKDAKKQREDIQLWEQLVIEITPENLEFSRIAVQAAAQTIKQHLKAIEKERFFEKFQDKQWELLKWKIIKSNNTTVVVEIDWVPVVLPPQWQIPHRIYEVWEDIFVYLNKIEKGHWWINLDITQSSKEYIIAILKKIVPELEEWIIEIKKIVRIPWIKTKIVVASNDPNVDPVWVMVGQWWDRINIVLSLLDWEKIDYIPWTEDIVELTKACMKPAEVKDVEVWKNSIKVYVDDKYKAIAIWKWASNVKLASMILWKKIEII